MALDPLTMEYESHLQNPIFYDSGKQSAEGMLGQWQLPCSCGWIGEFDDPRMVDFNITAGIARERLVKAWLAHIAREREAVH